MGAGKPRGRRCVLATDVPPEIASYSASVPTSLGCAGEWPQLLVDLVDVLRQNEFPGEGEATGDALKGALLEVDFYVMLFQNPGAGVRLATIYNRAGELLLRSGPLGAILDSCDGSLRLPLLALGQVEIQEVLRGEGGFTGWTRDCLSRVVLRPGVGGKGAWVDAKFCSILWAIGDEHLTMLENVLGGPTRRICRK